MKSNASASEGGNNVAETLKKTLSLLEHSDLKYSGVKSDGRSINVSSPLTPYKMSTLKINLLDNPCYSPVSLVIMQPMVTNSLTMKEHLGNLTKEIEDLTKYAQNQHARIDKLVDKMDVLIDRESIHAPRKALEVHEEEHPVKQA
ncbi:hypothetical protein FXO37_31260 [Capsicum annuum]|nr:hypothetical protein FXO37_31260 [Capsicum annuum]